MPLDSARREPRRARRLLEQRRGQGPLGVPQQEPPWQRLEQPGLPVGPELMGRVERGGGQWTLVGQLTPRWMPRRPDMVQDQSRRPAHPGAVPGVANRKGPGVWVAGWPEAGSRQLPGCSVVLGFGAAPRPRPSRPRQLAGGTDDAVA